MVVTWTDCLRSGLVRFAATPCVLSFFLQLFVRRQNFLCDCQFRSWNRQKSEAESLSTIWEKIKPCFLVYPWLRLFRSIPWRARVSKKQTPKRQPPLTTNQTSSLFSHPNMCHANCVGHLDTLQFKNSSIAFLIPFFLCSHAMPIWTMLTIVMERMEWNKLLIFPKPVSGGWLELYLLFLSHEAKQPKPANKTKNKTQKPTRHHTTNADRQQTPNQDMPRQGLKVVEPVRYLVEKVKRTVKRSSRSQHSIHLLPDKLHVASASHPLHSGNRNSTYGSVISPPTGSGRCNCFALDFGVASTASVTFAVAEDVFQTRTHFASRAISVD